MIKNKKRVVTFSNITSTYYYQTIDLTQNENWMIVAIDRMRFQKRINDVSHILEPVLRNHLQRIQEKSK